MAAQNVFEATARLLDARDWIAVPEVAGRASGPLTLHSALRHACGVDPGAWLAAYEDWETTTQKYSAARAALTEAAAERVGHPIEITVWAGRATRADVDALLSDLALAYPRATVPDPRPRLRPGCDPRKSPGSVKYSGVLAAAIASLSAVRPAVPICRLVAEAVAFAGIDLPTVDSETFLKALITAAGVPAIAPTNATASNFAAALRKAAQARTDYTVPGLLARLAEFTSIPLRELDDETLIGLLERAAVDRDPAFLVASGVGPGDPVAQDTVSRDE